MSVPVTMKPTREYGEFRLDDANRDLKQGHVERLAEGVEFLYLLDLYPIVTTTERVILDGQHRFTVARNMFVPFYYLSGDDISIEDIARANENTNYYRDDDLLSLYAHQSVPSYLYLKEYLKKYPHMGIPYSRKLLDDECDLYCFGEGEFSVRSPTYAKVVAERIKDFADIHPWTSQSVYRDALANLAFNPQYQHDRMMNRIAVDPRKLLRCRKREDAFSILTEIYNYGMMAGRRVKLQEVQRNQKVDKFDSGFETIESGIGQPQRGIDFRREVQVFSECDLDRFRFHPASRRVRKPQLNRLVEFMSVRNLLPYYPILVDKTMTIIDGTQRYLAAKELNLPIHYIVTENFSLHMSVIASGRTRTWTSKDYLKHFCELESPEYLYLRNLHTDHPFVNLAVLVVALGGGDGILAQHLYRAGKFKVSRRLQTEKWLAHLGMIQNPSLKRNAMFQRTFYNQIYNPKFDAGTFVRRLNDNPDQFGFYGDSRSCLEQIENVYNYRIGEKNRVKLTYIRPDEEKPKLHVRQLA